MIKAFGSGIKKTDWSIHILCDGFLKLLIVICIKAFGYFICGWPCGSPIAINEIKFHSYRLLLFLCSELTLRTDKNHLPAVLSSVSSDILPLITSYRYWPNPQKVTCKLLSVIYPVSLRNAPLRNIIDYWPRIIYFCGSK